MFEVKISIKGHDCITQNPHPASRSASISRTGSDRSTTSSINAELGSKNENTKNKYKTNIERLAMRPPNSSDLSDPSEIILDKLEYNFYCVVILKVNFGEDGFQSVKRGVNP